LRGIQYMLSQVFNTKTNGIVIADLLAKHQADTKELFVNIRAVAVGNDQSASISDTKVCTQGGCTVTWKPFTCKD
jgi:hypothetical protein